MQNITYLKIGSIFLTMLLKALNAFLKNIKDNYLGTSSNLMPRPFVSRS